MFDSVYLDEEIFSQVKYKVMDELKIELNDYFNSKLNSYLLLQQKADQLSLFNAYTVSYPTHKCGGLYLIYT
ncbi:MAG: hypothetical protein ATN31_09665 [Candidatus Epulonipiscioides saccharophilum]|nr:MAG: hypothetical protein ATN31_09665 [Epulopiscium sp. AS2M-Bin001]